MLISHTSHRHGPIVFKQYKLPTPEEQDLEISCKKLSVEFLCAFSLSLPSHLPIKAPLNVPSCGNRQPNSCSYAEPATRPPTQDQNGLQEVTSAASDHKSTKLSRCLTFLIAKFCTVSLGEQRLPYSLRLSCRASHVWRLETQRARLTTQCMAISFSWQPSRNTAPFISCRCWCHNPPAINCHNRTGRCFLNKCWPSHLKPLTIKRPQL